MKKEYIFAIPHKKENYIIDARNPYTWEEVGRVIVESNATEADLKAACKEQGIPEEAYCVASKLVL